MRHRQQPQSAIDLQTWSAEHRGLAKKARHAAVDAAKLLPHCRVTDLKVEVGRLAETAANGDLNLLYEEEQTRLAVQAVGSKVKAFKAFLRTERKDEAYFLEAESGAETVENLIAEVKQKYAEIYGDLEADCQGLMEELKPLEENLHVYEEKVHVDDDELEQVRKAEKRLRGETDNHHDHPLPSVANHEGNGATKVDVVEEVYRLRNQLGHDYRELIDRMTCLKSTIDELNQMIEINGGINCGWASSKDHSEYCKVRIRHQGRVDSIPFFDECKIMLPLYPPDQIREHNQSYNTYLKYDAKRKEVLGDYKKCKDRKRQLEGQHRAQALAVAEKAAKVDPEIERIERQRKKEEIERWKREKEVDKVIACERQDETVLKTVKVNEQKRQKELEEKKKIVQEYKEKKELEKAKEALRADALNNMKRYVSQEQKQRVKQKEDAIFEKKKQMALEKKAKEEEKKLKQEMLMLEKHKKYPILTKAREGASKAAR